MFTFKETVHQGWEILDGIGVLTQTTVRFASGIGVLTQTTVRFARPGAITEQELEAWLKREAKFIDEYAVWQVLMEGGEWHIESMDGDWEGFVSEVMSTLNEYGVSIVDRNAYRLHE